MFALSQITFKTSRSIAKAIVLNIGKEDPQRIAKRIVRLMDLKWQMLRPTVILSVTGGAQNLELSQHKELALMEGLVSAAQVSGAAIISAGTDAGLAQLLGQALRETRGVDVPLIGVVPFGAVKGHEGLRQHIQDKQEVMQPSLLGWQVDLGRIKYTYTALDNCRDAAALEPNHSHYVIADDGSRGFEAWGTEISLRSQIYLEMRARFNAPTVLVVVQGGPGTLKTVREALHHSVPTVLICGSGGAADLLAHWCRNADSRDADSRDADSPNPNDDADFPDDGGTCDIKGLSREKLANLRTVMGEKWLAELRTMVGEKREHITSVDLGQADKEEIDQKILQAVLSDNERRQHTLLSSTATTISDDREPCGLERADTSEIKFDDVGKFVSQQQRDQRDKAIYKLRVAVHWGRADIVESTIGDNPNTRDFLQDRALHLAIEMRQPRVVDLMIALRAKLERVRFLDLYIGAINQLPQLPQGNIYLLRDLAAHWRIDQQRSSKKQSTVAALLGRKEADLDYKISLYLDYVAPFLETFIPGYEAYFQNRCDDKSRKKKTCTSDIFYWAVLMRAWPLADKLWERIKNPVRAALLAAQLCHAACESEILMTDEVEELKKKAENFEASAVGVMKQSAPASF